MADDSSTRPEPASEAGPGAGQTYRRRTFLVAVSGLATLAGCLAGDDELGARGPEGPSAMETSGRVDATPLDSHPEELFPAASAFGEEWELSSEAESTDDTDTDGLVAETTGVFVTEGRAKAMTLTVRVYKSRDDAARAVEAFVDETDANVNEDPADSDPFGEEILTADWIGVNEHRSHLNVGVFREANVVVETRVSNNEGMTALRPSVMLGILDDVHASWAA